MAKPETKFRRESYGTKNGEPVAFMKHYLPEEESGVEDDKKALSHDFSRAGIKTVSGPMTFDQLVNKIVELKDRGGHKDLDVLEDSLRGVARKMPFERFDAKIMNLKMQGNDDSGEFRRRKEIDLIRETQACILKEISGPKSSSKPKMDVKGQTARA